MVPTTYQVHLRGTLLLDRSGSVLITYSTKSQPAQLLGYTPASSYTPTLFKFVSASKNLAVEEYISTSGDYLVQFDSPRKLQHIPQLLRQDWVAI